MAACFGASWLALSKALKLKGHLSLPDLIVASLWIYNLITLMNKGDKKEIVKCHNRQTNYYLSNNIYAL